MTFSLRDSSSLRFFFALFALFSSISFADQATERAKCVTDLTNKFAQTGELPSPIFDNIEKSIDPRPSSSAAAAAAKLAQDLSWRGGKMVHQLFTENKITAGPAASPLNLTMYPFSASKKNAPASDQHTCTLLGYTVSTPPADNQSPPGSYPVQCSTSSDFTSSGNCGKFSRTDYVTEGGLSSTRGGAFAASLTKNYKLMGSNLINGIRLRSTSPRNSSHNSPCGGNDPKVPDTVLRAYIDGYCRFKTIDARNKTASSSTVTVGSANDTDEIQRKCFQTTSSSSSSTSSYVSNDSEVATGDCNTSINLKIAYQATKGLYLNLADCQALDNAWDEYDDYNNDLSSQILDRTIQKDKIKNDIQPQCGGNHQQILGCIDTKFQEWILNAITQKQMDRFSNDISGAVRCIQ